MEMMFVLVWLAGVVGILIRLAVLLDRRDAAWRAHLQEMAQGYGRDVEERPARDLVEVVKKAIKPPKAKLRRTGVIHR